MSYRVLAGILNFPAVGCSHGQGFDGADGYEFSPVVNGSLTFESTSGELVEYAVDDARTIDDPNFSVAECYATTHAFFPALSGDTPGDWVVGQNPEVLCDDGLPKFSISESISAELMERLADWPQDSGEYEGWAELGREYVVVMFRVEVTDDMGTLRPFPKPSEDPDSKLPTTENYFRAYSISAEFSCSDILDSGCDGTWMLQLQYEQSAAHVSWYYNYF